MKKILLTGATGFLGSHIAEELVKQGYEVIALKRSSSILKNCIGFSDQIKWLVYDNLADSEHEISKLSPDILVHAAWDGVKASDRDNWMEQENNILFLVTLLELSKKAGIKKIIALGSQAEYGQFQEIVNEDYRCNPNTAYGSVKLRASSILKAYAEMNNIEWYWIRIFSVFGPREGDRWLIPSAIINLLDKKEMALTPCEQKYDYLYVRDFVRGILSVVKTEKNISGIYNMSSGSSISLKSLLSYLEKRLSPQQKLLRFGALSYRPDQVMNIQGNSERFKLSFNFKPVFGLEDGLEETIGYYINHRINE